MSQNERSKSLDSNVLDFEDFFMTRSAFVKKFQEEHPVTPSMPDSVDAEINRRIGEIQPNQASILDGIFAIAAICTFVADIVTDALAAKHHYENNDIAWFALTCIFIVLPSIIMQIFSCKWFREDYLKQTWWTYLLHLFQLGTIQRYILAFWYGLKTRRVKPVSHSDYIRYLTEWRDITLLRLFEGFLEAAPQMILQLYVLTIQNEFIVERDWLIATSAVLSIVSLSWAIVSYSQMLRLCLNSNVLSVFGYCFQISYRLLMVASRVVLLVLFASAFRYYIFVFVFGHCAIMFGWLCCMDMISHNVSEDDDEPVSEKIFTLIVSVIYLFCFLNVNPLTTKRQISIYYSVMFFESAILMAAWFPYRTLHGVLMYASFGLVFGGFFTGLAFMLLYYKYFHPSQDITAGWFCCSFFSRRSTDTGYPIVDDSSVSIVENGDVVIVNIKGDKEHSSRPATPNSAGENNLSIPLELIRPHSPSRAKKTRSDSEQAKIVDSVGNPGEYTGYGSMSSPNLASKGRNPRSVVSDGALGIQSRENGHLQESQGSKSGKKEDGEAMEKPEKRWTAQISKGKDLNRMYEEKRLLNDKTKLGDLHLSGNVKSAGKPHEGVWENMESRPLFERKQSRDDSEVNLGGKEQFKTSGKTRRKSLNDRELIMENSSSSILDQKAKRKQERCVFSDSNLNEIECNAQIV